MTLPDLLDGQLRLPYPTTIEMTLDGEQHKLEGELVSIGDDGTTRTFIIRLASMHQNLHISMPAGEHKIETVYDEHGVKWARTVKSC